MVENKKFFEAMDYTGCLVCYEEYGKGDYYYSEGNEMRWRSDYAIIFRSKEAAQEAIDKVKNMPIKEKYEFFQALILDDTDREMSDTFGDEYYDVCLNSENEDKFAKILNRMTSGLYIKEDPEETYYILDHRRREDESRYEDKEEPDYSGEGPSYEEVEDAIRNAEYDAENYYSDLY